MKSVVNIMRTYIRTEWEQQTESIFLSGHGTTFDHVSHDCFLWHKE